MMSSAAKACNDLLRGDVSVLVASRRISILLSMNAN